MILAHVLVKASIIFACVLLFIVTYVLNKRTKAPKIDDKIEKCSTCTNQSCIVKLTEIEEIKKEYKKEIEAHEKGAVVNAFDSCENSLNEENNDKE